MIFFTDFLSLEFYVDKNKFGLYNISSMVKRKCPGDINYLHMVWRYKDVHLS